MANSRARLLGPPPSENQTDTAGSSPGYQIAGRRSGEGTDSVLEQLQNDPARKATEPPVEGHPEVDSRFGYDN